MNLEKKAVMWATAGHVSGD